MRLTVPRSWENADRLAPASGASPRASPLSLHGDLKNDGSLDLVTADSRLENVSTSGKEGLRATGGLQRPATYTPAAMSLQHGTCLGLSEIIARIGAGCPPPPRLQRGLLRPRRAASEAGSPPGGHGAKPIWWSTR